MVATIRELLDIEKESLEIEQSLENCWKNRHKLADCGLIQMIAQEVKAWDTVDGLELESRLEVCQAALARLRFPDSEIESVEQSLVQVGKIVPLGRLQESCHAKRYP
jgi:sigma54-dependent transcription regulator